MHNLKLSLIAFFLIYFHVDGATQQEVEFDFNSLNQVPISLSVTDFQQYNNKQVFTVALKNEDSKALYIHGFGEIPSSKTVSFLTEENQFLISTSTEKNNLIDAISFTVSEDYIKEVKTDFPEPDDFPNDYNNRQELEKDSTFKFDFELNQLLNTSGFQSKYTETEDGKKCVTTEYVSLSEKMKKLFPANPLVNGDLPLGLICEVAIKLVYWHKDGIWHIELYHIAKEKKSASQFFRPLQSSQLEPIIDSFIKAFINKLKFE